MITLPNLESNRNLDSVKEIYSKFSPISLTYTAGIIDFLKRVWFSRAVYKIFMTKRAFNLNHIAMNILNAWSTPGYHLESITSDTGLLAEAESLAKYYVGTKQFPPILIVDDFIIHGRKIYKLIRMLEKLVISFLNEDMRDEKHYSFGEYIDEKIIHERLRNAITIYVFARQSEEEIIKELDFKKILVHTLHLKEINVLSGQITDFILHAGTANTCHTLSLYLPAYKAKWNDHIKDGQIQDKRVDAGSSYRASEAAFCYRGKCYTYYYRHYLNNVMEIMEISTWGKQDNYRCTFTASNILNDLDIQQFHEVCGFLSSFLKRYIEKSIIAKILSYKQDALIKPRVQIISFLLSCLTFTDFYNQKYGYDKTKVYKAFLESNFKKIAMNFNRGNAICVEMKKIFRIICYDNPGFLDDLKLEWNRQIKECNGWIHKISHSDKDSFLTPDIEWPECSWDSEYYFYKNKIKRIRYGLSNALNKTLCDEDSGGYENMENYLEEMEKKQLNVFSSIGWLLAMTDRDQVFIHEQFIHEQFTVDSQDESSDIESQLKAEYSIKCTIRAGNQSLLCIPKRLAVFIPAMAIVEKSNRNLEKRLLMSLMDLFISYIIYKHSNKHTDNNKYIDNTKHVNNNSNDVKNELNKLDKNIQVLDLYRYDLLRLYNAGYHIRDLDIKLIDRDDLIADCISPEGNIDYVQLRNKKINFSSSVKQYKMYAREFIDKWRSL